MSWKNRLFIIFQYLIPQHFITRMVAYIANCNTPWIKDNLIDWFIKKYSVDMTEAEKETSFDYKNFNDFFTRALKQNIRPINTDKNIIVSPVDGSISQVGKVSSGRIFQAKGHSYSLLELMGGNKADANAFEEGSFSTIYLAPKDYHRIHMPLNGTLKKMIYIPGKLFSVNKLTTENVPQLFSKNERVVCLFDTEIGSVAIVLVGAMIVGSIETTWAGQVTPFKKEIKSFSYNNPNPEIIQINKGEEFARFKLGSTAIVLFERNKINWNETLTIDSDIKMGQNLANKYQEQTA